MYWRVFLTVVCCTYNTCPHISKCINICICYLLYLDWHSKNGTLATFT